MRMEELYETIRELRDINEIKDISYQYWYAIDSKDPELLRDVYAPGKILIDYEDCPVFTDRNEFVDFFVSMAMDPARQENHFGSSPKITFQGNNDASATWRLNMFAYNFDTRTVMRVTGQYDNEYTRVLGKWKVRKSIFRRHSLFSENISTEGNVNVPHFGGVSPDARSHLYGN